MKHLLAVVAVCASLATPCFGQEVCVYSYTFDKKYSSKIPDAKLARSPSWDMTSDTPPFPLGKAIRLANELRVKLVRDSDRYKWHLMSATLERLDPSMWEDDPELGHKCWWSVRYEASLRKGGSTGLPEFLIVIVLMDGTVIDPQVSDYKWNDEQIYDRGHFERDKSGEMRHTGGE